MAADWAAAVMEETADRGWEGAGSAVEGWAALAAQGWAAAGLGVVGWVVGSAEGWQCMSHAIRRSRGKAGMTRRCWAAAGEGAEEAAQEAAEWAARAAEERAEVGWLPSTPLHLEQSRSRCHSW